MKIINFCLIPLSLVCCTAKRTIPEGFVYLQEVAPDIAVELRYYSSNNFVGDTIDGYLDRKCIITSKGALALLEVQSELKQMGYGLKVYDAYRPQQAVDHFVEWAKDFTDTTMKKQFYPSVAKSQLFQKGYISAKSGHTRGSTIDLTIIYRKGTNQGKELDMGTPWDFFSHLSWPENKDISKEQLENRMLLQKVMVIHGFKPLKEEWWHFTLVDEPFPDTYFDFPVQ